MPTFKYPVPQLAALTVTEWAAELAAHLGCSVADVLERPVAVIRFPLKTVRIELMQVKSNDL